MMQLINICGIILVSMLMLIVLMGFTYIVVHFIKIMKEEINESSS